MEILAVGGAEKTNPIEANFKTLLGAIWLGGLFLAG